MVDIEDHLRGPAHDLLEWSGEDVTLVNRVATGEDEYGDPIYQEEHIETAAEIIPRGTPAFERRAEGIDAEVRAVAWVKDTLDVYHGDESDIRAPTRVITDTHRWLVYDWYDEHNGKYRLHLTD